MKRILLLTAVLVAAFTIQAFATTTDNTTVTVNVDEIFNIDSPTSASTSLDVPDYTAGHKAFNGGNVSISANDPWIVTGNWGSDNDHNNGKMTDGAVTPHLLDLAVDLGAGSLVSEDDVAAVTLETGTAQGPTATPLDFDVSGITWTGTPPGSYTVTVNFSIASNDGP